MTWPGRISADSKRRREGRRAGVAVLAGLAAFVLLQLGLAVVVETTAPEVRDPLYGCRLERVRRRLCSAPEQPRTVIMLGSSRTRFGFRAGKEDESWGRALGRPVAAFNFGIDGGGPLMEWLTWRRLLRDGVRPDLLLVEVTPPFLAGQIPVAEFDEIHLPTSRLSWQDLPLVERFAGNERVVGLRDRWLGNWPAPWYTHRVSLLSLACPILLPHVYRLDEAWKVDASGGMGYWTAPPIPGARGGNFQPVRKGFDPYLTGFRLGGPQCDALRDLLTSCCRERVPVALVLMPEGPAFRSWYPPETWRTVQEWLGQVCREYDLPLINAREWMDEDDFIDSNHLRASGADKFTERLGREYVLPLLRAAAPSSP